MTQPSILTLLCPRCGREHVDRGEWATKVHTTHLCEFCGKTWRPQETPSFGVPGAGTGAQRIKLLTDDFLSWAWAHTESRPEMQERAIAEDLEALQRLLPHVDALKDLIQDIDVPKALEEALYRLFDARSRRS